MPVYEAECRKCGTQRDYFASIEKRNALVPKCCGKIMKRVITGAMLGIIQQDISYVSPATGALITSHAARRDDLKRSRSRPFEGYDTEMQESKRKRKYIEEKQDAKIEDAARRAWHQLPSSKRKVLEGSE